MRCINQAPKTWGRGYLSREQMDPPELRIEEQGERTLGRERDSVNFTNQL